MTLSSFTAPDLPVSKVLPEIKAVLNAGNSLVLQAEPGAGKTTVIPPALLQEPWLQDRKILVLEPRRLAARAAACRICDICGGSIGNPAGYRVRLDTKITKDSRIEILTEGVFIRRLQQDPSLEGVGLVIFDEFHERGLDSDLALALVLESREALREDLRLLIMSATLDGERTADLLGGCPVIGCTGRSFPVETTYLPPERDRSVEEHTTAAVHRALEDSDGDILVFLPGAGSIKKVQAGLSGWKDGLVLPLFGNLSREAQQQAILPDRDGRRKVILATSIAQTSLTIEGVSTVIDSGLIRRPCFDPGSGLSRLVTVPVSLASADQRTGRAGRLGSGRCLRLWQKNGRREAFDRPAVLDAELASFVLQLALWGESDPGRYTWMDAPPVPAFERALRLLKELGAVDESGRITHSGKKMAVLPVHPRLAHMIVRGAEIGQGRTAALLAAMLEERDFLRSNSGRQDADAALQIALLSGQQSAVPAGFYLDEYLLKQIRKHSRQLEEICVVGSGEEIDPDACGLLLSFAYPDRIGIHRKSNERTFLLSGGGNAGFFERDTLADSECIVAATVDGTKEKGIIRLAAVCNLKDIMQHHRDLLEQEDSIGFDGQSGRVKAVRRVSLGAVTLEEKPIANPSGDLVIQALLDGIRQTGSHVLPWDKKCAGFCARVTFVNSLPDIQDKLPSAGKEELLTAIDEWLAPYLDGYTSLEQLKKLDLYAILKARINFEQTKILDRAAPTHLTVPSGSRLPITYQENGPPVLAVRLQEMFGLTRHPHVGNGNVPLVIHLLSPASRPLQITSDIAGFWKNSYADVRKEMRGRYPKHYWPDDPLSAVPTSRARPREKG